MRTLDVVVKDLKLRLGIDAGVVREQEIFVRLLSVRAVCIFANKDLAVKNTTRSCRSIHPCRFGARCNSEPDGR